jgi:hypothetical protein
MAEYRASGARAYIARLNSERIVAYRCFPVSRIAWKPTLPVARLGEVGSSEISVGVALMELLHSDIDSPVDDDMANADVVARALGYTSMRHLERAIDREAIVDLRDRNVEVARLRDNVVLPGHRLVHPLASLTPEGLGRAVLAAVGTLFRFMALVNGEEQRPE